LAGIFSPSLPIEIVLYLAAFRRGNAGSLPLGIDPVQQKNAENAVMRRARSGLSSPNAHRQDDS